MLIQCLPNVSEMDPRRTVFVLLLILAAGEVSSDKITVKRTVNAERTPDQKLKEEIESLSRDNPLLMVEKFEKLTRDIAKTLGQDGRVETGVVTVTTHGLDLGTVGSRIPLRIFDINSDSLIEIPKSKIKSTPQGKFTQTLTVVAAWWKNISNLPSPRVGFLPQNTTAVTLAYFLDVDGANESKESFPVDFQIDISNDYTPVAKLKPNERLRGLRRTCAWIDLSKNRWSESGCVTTTYNEMAVHCSCNHTTTFATLLMLDTYEPVPYEIRVATLVFEITSIVCLAITIVFICLARHRAGIDSASSPQATGMKANRTNSQVSLCFSLLCMHVAIVSSDLSRITNDARCVVATVFTHYFVLSSAFWSFCEGMAIFVKVCPRLALKVRYRTMTLVQCTVGWIVPLIITIFAAAYGIPRGIYMDETLVYEKLHNRTATGNDTVATPRYEECWLSKKSGMVWAALGPAIAIVSVNLAILCYITKEVIKMKRSHPCRSLEMSDSQNYVSQSNTLRRGTTPTIVLPSSTEIEVEVTSPSVTPATNTNCGKINYIVSVTRSFGVLMPILAVPWVLSILANIPNASVVLGTAHAVINGLQGFEIFLLYCVVNKNDWRKVRRKWRNSEIMRLFSKYRYTRRESVSMNNNGIAFKQKRHQPRTDSNGNAYLHAAWQTHENMQNSDTLSSCRSNSGTINSTQSRQSLLKKSSKWWKR